MTIRRTLIASLIATMLLVSPILAEAAALGEISSLSPIGAPLRIEIGIPGGRAREVGACLRVVAPPNGNNDLPTIRRGRISAVGSGVNAAIVVSSSESMQHPIAQLTIENTCESRLRRTYTLLFPYPSAPMKASVPSAAETPLKAAAKPAGVQQWTTAPGESLNEIARALYPDNPGARRAFIRKTTQANPALFPDARSRAAPLPPGTRLSIPNLADISRSSTPESTRKPALVRNDDAGSKAKRRQSLPSAQTGDRLVVAPDVRSAASGARSGDLSAGVDRQLTGASSREEEISAAIDRSIVTQMELLARIKELEQIQSRLMERAAQIGVAPPPAQTSAPAAAIAHEAPQPVKVEPKAAPQSAQDWTLIAALGAGAAFIAALLLLRTRRQTRPTSRPASPGVMTASTSSIADTPLSIGGVAPVTEMPAPTQGPAPAAILPLEWDHTPSGFGQLDLAPLAEEEEVEEHDSAIELAEIMMSFGRVHGAAETLADFIRSNPKQAVTPWLKLLEVYRAADLKVEFDALARQLNKTFNVKAVTWENFDEARTAPDTLEQMPHLLAAVQELWGTRDCQAYLQKLLRDNRDGTRQGFPLVVIDDILCLSAVLEQQLGPYRPTVEEHVADNGPETEPPAT